MQSCPSDSAPAPSDISRAAAGCAVLIACLTRIGLLFLLARLGHFIFDPDEQFRYIVAHRWMRHPVFFQIFEGKWLPGDAVYYGLWMKFHPDPLIGFLCGLTLSHALNLACAAWLAATAGGRRWCGALAALLLAPAYLAVRTGEGPTVELNLATASMAATAFALRWLRHNGGPGGWREALGCGISLVAATSIHLQGWIFAAILGAIVLAQAGVAGMLASATARRQLLWLGICLAAFPTAWVIGSWVELGAPFQFVRNYQSTWLTEAARGMAAGQTNPLRHFPRLLGAQIWPILPLCLGSLLPSRAGSRRDGLVLAAIAAALMLLLEWTIYTQGFFPPHAQRIIYLPFLFVVAACAAWARSFESLWRRLMRPGAKAMVAAAGFALLALWGAYNSRHILDYGQASVMRTWPNDIHALGAWLRRESWNPQKLPALSWDTKMGVYDVSGPGSGETCFLLMYMTGFENIFAIPAELWNGRGPAGEDYQVVFTDQPAAPPGYDLAARVVDWGVYVRQRPTIGND